MIVLSNIEKKLGSFRLAIERLEVRQGEYLVILGPSGAGKTVLLLTIAGLLRPDTGKVLLNGLNITTLPAHRRDVGLVFQESNLFPHLSVIQNISFGKRYRKKKAKEIEARIEVLVEMLGIRTLLERNVEGLSGGEKQRVAVARALAIAPTIFLLDEPLGLLDHNAREELRNELRRIHDELGTTTLHVTHDRNEAFSVADRIAVLNEGRLVQVSRAHEIIARPVSEFVARFIGIENVLEACAERDASGKTFLRVGECRLPVGSDCAGRVRFCIRPEAISLRREVPAGMSRENLLPGVVKSIEEKGALVRVLVKCPPGEVVVACEKRQFLETGLSCSSPVFLEFDSAAIHVLLSSG